MIQTRGPRATPSRSLTSRRTLTRPATFPSANRFPCARLLPSTTSFPSGRSSSLPSNRVQFDGQMRTMAVDRGARLNTPKIVIELAEGAVVEGERDQSTQMTPPNGTGSSQMALVSGRTGANFTPVNYAGNGGSDESSCRSGDISSNMEPRKELDTAQTQRRATLSTLSPPVGPRRRKSTSFTEMQVQTPMRKLGVSPGHARRISQPLPPSEWLATLHGSARRESQIRVPPAAGARIRGRGSPLYSGGSLDSSRVQTMSAQRRHSDHITSRPFTTLPSRSLRRLSSEPVATTSHHHYRGMYRRQPEAHPRQHDVEVVSDLKNGNISAPTMRLLGLVQRVPKPGKMRCLLRRLDSPPIDVLSERSRRVTIQFHSGYHSVPDTTRARSFSMSAMDCAKKEAGGGVVCKTDDILLLQKSFEKLAFTVKEEVSTSSDVGEPSCGPEDRNSRALSPDDSVVPWEGTGLLVNVRAIGKALEEYLNASDNFSQH